jgi:ATP-dependent helicase/nuclease subunit B
MPKTGAHLTLLVARASHHLLSHGREFIRRHHGRLLIVSGSAWGNNDVLYNSVDTVRLGAYRFTLKQLARETARSSLAKRGIAIAERITLEAILAQLIDEARPSLTYFRSVADTPHFCTALYNTLNELRCEAVTPPDLAAAQRGGKDLARLLTKYQAALQQRGLADEHDVLREATRIVNDRTHTLATLPLLLNSISCQDQDDRQFMTAVIKQSAEVLALAPDHEAARMESLLGVEKKTVPENVDTCLASIQRYLFTGELAPQRAPDASFELFAAAAESLECAEIARRILALTATGVSFDRIGILLRAPQTYIPVLEEACEKAGIETYIAHGARKPHTAGRALLALLEFARENYPASRFFEYLSLHEVPDGDDSAPPLPIFWEQIVNNAAVIGGRDRWTTRLTALRDGIAAKITPDTDPDDEERSRRHIATIEDLQARVLRIIDLLDRAPEGEDWGIWLAWLEELTAVGIRDRTDITLLLEQLGPLAGIQRVTLDDVVRTLRPHLRTLPKYRREYRYGRVFIGALAEGAGMTFDTVFVPGLAEGSFPRQIVGDPLLLNDERALVATHLQHTDDTQERELLQGALTACAKHFYASWSQMDLQSGRHRVPSLYPFELTRAAGRHYGEPRELETEARNRVQTRAAWPAPAKPQPAIDSAEFDLAMLQPPRTRTATMSALAYLQRVEAPIHRSLQARYRRWDMPKWTADDGFSRFDEPPILAAFGLTERPYSASALEDYSTCPYRFYLRNIIRLRPIDRPAPVWRIDRSLRGDMFHRCASRLTQRCLIGGKTRSLDEQLALLEEVISEVEQEFRATAAPAAEAVWATDIKRLRNDLRGLVRQQAADTVWSPIAAELGFGLAPAPYRDAASTATPLTTARGYQLVGSVDLVERRQDNHLRVVDYKTSRFERREYYDDKGVRRLKGGTQLQPLLYSLAINRVFNTAVVQGTLSFATIKGRYETVSIPYAATTEAELDTILRYIDEAITGGFLPAAPLPDACEKCDYRSVCGPYEQQRTSRKKESEDLSSLRSIR